MINIICVGNKCEYDKQIKEFEKRLKKPFLIKWIYINNKVDNNVEFVKTEETKNIIKYLNKDSFNILLDERGKNIDNDELCKKLTASNNDINIIIGGCYGVDLNMIKSYINFTWSFSTLVFPYPLCRLMLVEQIYRSMTIFFHHPYHHK